MIQSKSPEKQTRWIFSTITNSLVAWVLETILLMHIPFALHILTFQKYISSTNTLLLFFSQLPDFHLNRLIDIRDKNKQSLTINRIY